MSLLIRILILLIPLGLLSCVDSRIKQSTDLIEFVAKKGIDNSFRNIMVLTENGCPNCNRSFALLLEKQVKNPNSLFIISASGNYVDISVFLEHEQRENILYDFKGEYEELHITEGTSAIFMDNNKRIDTIIPIRAENISETLKYISNRIRANAP